MLMSHRLAEQVLDVHFENPSAVLAALKGSPKIAELKVLPGGAPVRASAVGEGGATAEGCVKKARIEANSDKTQIDELR
jgi:hypothetical protein